MAEKETAAQVQVTHLVYLTAHGRVIRVNHGLTDFLQPQAGHGGPLSLRGSDDAFLLSDLQILSHYALTPDTAASFSAFST